MVLSSSCDLSNLFLITTLKYLTSPVLYPESQNCLYTCRYLESRMFNIIFFTFPRPLHPKHTLLTTLPKPIHGIINNQLIAQTGNPRVKHFSHFLCLITKFSWFYLPAIFLMCHISSFPLLSIYSMVPQPQHHCHVVPGNSFLW